MTFEVNFILLSCQQKTAVSNISQNPKKQSQRMVDEHLYISLSFFPQNIIIYANFN